MRKRQSKFICVNDNIANMTQPLRSALHAFYESFFPSPSQFERRGAPGKAASRVGWIVVLGVFFAAGFAAVSFFAICSVCEQTREPFLLTRFISFDGAPETGLAASEQATGKPC